MKLPVKLAMVAATMACVPSAASSQNKPVSEWATKKVPIEIFGQFPLISDPRITPNGKWIAAKVRADGQQVLALLAIGQANVAPMIIARDSSVDTDKQGERRIVEYRWLDDDHLLIGMASRDNFAGDWFDNVRYASFNRSTKKTIPLGWSDSFAATQLLWASHSGAPRILLQRVTLTRGTELYDRPEVLEIDAETGKSTIAIRQNAEVMSWEADADGIVRMGSSRDRSTGKVRVMYRPDGASQMKTIYNAVPDRYADHPLPDVILSGAGRAYSTSNADGYSALYEYDLANMKLGKRIYGVDGYDIGALQLSPDRKKLDGLTVTTDRTKRVFFDPRLKEIQAALEHSYGKGNVLIATADDAREKIVFRVAAMGQPESWYVYDTVTGGIGLIAYASDTLKDVALNPVSVVRYPATDGKQIEAVLTMPRHRVGEKHLPLIVLPHGGPWARDDADWDVYGWAQALAELGYVVIQPNFRGSTGYGRDWDRPCKNGFADADSGFWRSALKVER